MTEPVKRMLEERNATHGDWVEQFHVAHEYKRIARSASSWEGMTTRQREAMDMIMTKLSRVLCGDPNFPDHWKDIIGYSNLVLRELEENK